MKKCFSLVLLLFVTAFCYGQRVNLITVDQLHERIRQGKDTTYIVNFWTTWCAPCIQEIPHFEKLLQEKKTDKLRVLLVSLDTKQRLKNSVMPLVKRSKLKSEVFLLDESDPQKYIDRIDQSWSGAIPATLFIKNRNRKFIEREFTYQKLLNEYQEFK